MTVLRIAGSARLIGVGERAEDTGRSAVIHQTFARSDALGFERLDFRPVHADQQQAGDKGTEDLTEDVMRHLLPWEPLPDGEADGDCWVEVSARGRSTGDDGEGDTNGKGPSDLEERSECGNPGFVFEV